MAYIGEFAALFTSICWSFSAIGFTKSSEEVGSQVTNRVRVLLALLALLLINAILYGQPVPLHAGISRWVWLSVSGVIGLSLGDAFLSRPTARSVRGLGLLLLSLAPIFGAAIAWVFFGQALSLLQIAGIVVTLAGIFWVVLVRPEEGNEHVRRVTGRDPFRDPGGPRAGDRAGAFPTGDGRELSPFAGTLIRMIAAVVTLWIVASFQRQAGNTVDTMRKQPGVLGWVAFGALFGPVLGVFVEPAGGPAYRDRCRQHADGPSAGLHAADQLLRL